jgi:hypothetical protein
MPPYSHALALTSTLMKRAFLIPLFLSACTALPDVQPFADATAQLHDGLERAGEITVARVAGGEEVRAPEDDEEPTTAWQLQQVWETRLFAAEALVAYSDSLAEIVAAGKDASNGAERLGSTINEIAEQIPGVGTLSPGLVGLGQRLVTTAIEVKASRDLADAVEKADPAVAGIAEILVEDLDDLLALYKKGYRDVVRERYAAVDSEYKKLRDHRDNVQKEVETLRAAFDVPAEDGGDPEEASAQLQSAEELLAQTNAAFLPLWERRQALEKEREDLEALVELTRKAAGAWRQTHLDLSTAIDEGRRPNWRELLREAQELYELVEVIIEENEKADAPTMNEKKEGETNG